MGRTFHRVRAPPRSRAAARERRRRARSRCPRSLACARTPKRARDRRAPGCRQCAPLRPFRNQFRPRRKGWPTRSGASLPPSPILVQRYRNGDASSASSFSSSPSPLSSSSPVPRMRTGRGRRPVDDRASFRAARRNVGGRYACPAGRRRVFGGRGSRRMLQGGRALPHPAHPISPPPPSSLLPPPLPPSYLSGSSSPIQQPGDGRGLRKALSLGVVRCGQVPSAKALG